MAYTMLSKYFSKIQFQNVFCQQHKSTMMTVLKAVESGIKHHKLTHTPNKVIVKGNGIIDVLQSPINTKIVFQFFYLP
jgi:hypothetical protein